MIESSDLKPLQRLCLLALRADTKQRLSRARGGFVSSDRTALFTTRTVNGLEALGLLRVTSDMINAHVQLTAAGMRLADELASAGALVAVAEAGAA